MRVTVLGASASYAGPGQACSGYLIDDGETRVLVDCGSGVLSNLGDVADPLRLAAVFISHRHPDHFVDLYALQALLRYAPEGPAPALPLYAPPGLLDLMGRLLDERGAEELRASFLSRDLVAGRTVSVGKLEVTPLPVDHAPDSMGFRIASDGALVCYTSDSRFGDSVIALAEGADLLLAEVTLPQAYAGKAPHMTASEAGELAVRAGVRALVLTHLWPTADRAAVSAEARARFTGPVVLAEEMLVIDVPRRDAPGT